MAGSFRKIPTACRSPDFLKSGKEQASWGQVLSLELARVRKADNTEEHEEALPAPKLGRASPGPPEPLTLYLSG